MRLSVWAARRLPFSFTITFNQIRQSNPTSFLFLFTPIYIPMNKTTRLFLSPASGTVIKPIYEYDDQQKEKLQALREVCLSSCALKEVSRLLTH
jgi:hypothetical protein